MHQAKNTAFYLGEVELFLGSRHTVKSSRNSLWFTGRGSGQSLRNSNMSFYLIYW